MKANSQKQRCLALQYCCSRLFEARTDKLAGFPVLFSVNLIFT